MNHFTNKNGISLLIGLGFSLAILTGASLISSAITQAQRNVRGIEDVNIAFFAAESGIEESLYYMSFHKKGFEAQNDDPGDFQGYERLTGSNVNNVGFKWNISSQINSGTSSCPAANYKNTNEQCKGAILFGKSAALNFSYDNNSKTTTEAINEVHANPLNTLFTFSTDPEDTINTAFDSGVTDDSLGDRIVMTWLGSYALNPSPIGSFDPDADTTEIKILPEHDDDEYLGRRDIDPGPLTDIKPGDDGDCSNAKDSNGKFFCQEEIYDIKTNNALFQIKSTVNGFIDNDTTNRDNLQNFFAPDNPDGNERKTWKNLKFFYVNLIEGADPIDPSLGTIYYTITPPSTGDTITATKSFISAEGRSKNILSNLEVIVDNTEEFTALDYGVLLE